MTKLRNKVDISQMDNLAIDALDNPRSKRRLPRINGNALSRIVSDIETRGIDHHVDTSNVDHEGNKNNATSFKPLNDGPGEDSRNNSGSNTKKSKPRKSPSSNAKTAIANSKATNSKTSNSHSKNANSSSKNVNPNSKNSSSHSKNANSNSKHSNSKATLEPLNPLTAAEHTNVTCRFVLKPELSLTPYNINVDTPIPSHFIWRVISPAKECPICLNLAEVPRMLSCGHIMCIHCMIEHRQFSNSPNTCPICGETVNPNPIRAMPVTFMHSEPAFLPTDGDETILTLMSRPAQSALALPVDVESPKGSRFKRFPPPDYTCWTRIGQGDLSYAKEELSKELKYLIGASKKSVQEYGSDEGYNDGIAEIKRYMHMLNTQYGGENHDDKDPTSSSSSVSTATSVHTPQNKHNNKPRPPKIPQSDETVYFYQTAFESSTVYTLDSLDVSILKSIHGDYTSFPSSLVVKIENIRYTIYDRLRDKRLKYLSHLPEQTPVAFIECDWTGLLEPAILEKFGSKLQERKRHKQQMQAQDLAERKQAQASIERQFQLEVAEALLPHADVSGESSGGIDTTQLPSLSRSSAPPEHKVDKTPWVDEQKEREELLKNAYVPKRGRKEMILRF